jgi:hypothetical protein
MSRTAIVFMAGAWIFVLGLMFWSWRRLMQVDPSKEHPPPPGTSL